jgi:hypothetical protein
MKRRQMLMNRQPEGGSVAGKFARENREFGSPEQGAKASVHFSHTFPVVRQHDLFSLSVCR